MFDSTVENLVTNQGVPTFEFWRNREFLKFLREAEPQAFSKLGNRIVFVGSTDDFFSRRDEINEKIRGLGYNGPVCDDEDYAKRGSGGTNKVIKTKVDTSAIDALSDEELFQRIQDTFGSLTLLSEAAANLKIRSLIVSGSAGTGKTFEVIKAMKAKFSEDRSFYYHQIKGTISPIALYIELYRAKDGVLILDDADEGLTDNECLQLLKAATESSKNRSVSYRKLSLALENEGIPNEFEFSGCVVVLTNTNLEDARKQKQTHYDAIMSRAHYINAVLATDREKIMRIRHIITTTSMLNQFLDPQYHQEVIDFIEEYHVRFRELSIRTVVKLAELRAAFPEKWEVLARGTLLV